MEKFETSEISDSLEFAPNSEKNIILINKHFRGKYSLVGADILWLLHLSIEAQIPASKYCGPPHSLHFFQYMRCRSRPLPKCRHLVAPNMKRKQKFCDKSCCLVETEKMEGLCFLRLSKSLVMPLKTSPTQPGGKNFCKCAKK